MNSKTKKTNEKRIISILLIFAIFGIYLLINIFRLDYLKYDYYRNKAYDQVTTSSVLKAKRGSIYDSNMNLLAESATSWRVFVSTKDIRSREKADGVDYVKTIADGISGILSIDKKALYDKIRNAKVLDVTIKKGVSEDDYKKILSFATSKNIENLIYFEAESKRNYPNQKLCAHVIGFCGSDNQGLYGLEYYYDDILKGTDGYYVYAKDAGGKTLDTEYSDYFPAEDGYSIVTTIDSYIQTQLEAVIELAKTNHSAQNRVTGIVMDTKTGAILAMATTSPFDPNEPFMLDEESQHKLNESGLVVGTDEYNAYKNELLQIMWSNKAISETYEPGSTFKIVTVSTALDLGVATPESRYSCKGYYQIGGWRIRCHKTTGHGSGFNLAYGLQMSCNPCMMVLSQSVGSDNFYEYVKKFGYFEKSGIDLPSEASTIFHEKENIGSTELATASFGQRFKVSIINHLRAISSVANDGKLVTPYIADKIIDNNGNIVWSHKTEIKRQVVSKDVANTVSQILIDGVNGDGGAKNAGAEGYDIAAKTGTSQKFDILDENGNSYLRVGSCVAYSINENQGVSTIIVVDEPASNVKYGSVVAAPYISMLMEKILPYLEFRSNAQSNNFEVESYIGMNIETVKAMLDKSKIKYEIIGEGNAVISQIPQGGEILTKDISKIILYTTKEEQNHIVVPNLIGLSGKDAIIRATNAGLSVRILGISSIEPTSLDIVSEQSLPPGEVVKNGSVITIRILRTDYND